jgi:hypothetical protein
MGWIAIVIICVVLLLIILNVSSSRRRRKSASRQDTAVLPPKKSSEGVENSKVEAIEEASSEHIDLSVLEGSRDKHKQEGRQRVSKEATAHGFSGEAARTYARYDWQKHFEESILTPFPEEWSPALPHLHEAYKLEEEGADREKIQKVLEKAHRLDKDATAFYLGRMSIIKKVRGESQHSRGQPQ